MEQSLQAMVKEMASGPADREKDIREACEKALILFGQASLTNLVQEMKQSWGGFVQPFQLGLRSRSARVVIHSLQGFQAAAYSLLQSEMDGTSREHLIGIVDNILGRCAWSSSDVQLERVKVVLALVCANPSFVHGDQLERVFEMFIEIQSSVRDTATKTAALAASQQIIHLLGQQVQEYCKVCSDSEDGDSSWKGPGVVGDYLLMLKSWTLSLQEFQSVTSHDMPGFVCQIGFLEALLACTTPELVKLRIDVSSVLRDQLVPSIAAAFAHYIEITPFRLNPLAASSARITRRLLTYLCSITSRLVRLMGSVLFLRPALTALLRSVVLAPTPEKRAIALQQCLHKVFSSLDSLLALAGPTESGSSTMESVVFGDGQLELLNQLLTGVTECVCCSDSTTRKTAVDCIVAFVASLEELHVGKESISPTIVRSLQLFAKEMPHANKAPIQLSLAVLLGADGPLPDATPEGIVPSSHEGHPPAVENGDSSATEAAKPELPQPVQGDEEMANGHSSSAAAAADEHVESGDTEDGENEAADCQTSRLNHAYALSDAGEDVRPAAQDSVPAPISRSAGPCVAPNNSILFVKMLSASLPALLKLSNGEMVDDKLQQMASLFCSLSTANAVIPDPVQSVQLVLPADISESDSSGGPSVLTADSVYIACYGALAMNLCLSKEGFYSQPRDLRETSLSLDKFMLPLSNTGIILSLSPHWIRNLYNLLLENDLLAKAGFNGDERLTASPGLDSLSTARGDGSGDGPALIDILIWTFPFLSQYTKPVADSLPERLGGGGVPMDGILSKGLIGSISVPAASDSEEASVMDGARAPLLQFSEAKAPVSSLVDSSVLVFVCKDLLQAAWRSTLMTLQQPLQAHSASAATHQPMNSPEKSTHSIPVTNRTLVGFPLHLISPHGGGGGGDKTGSDAAMIVSCLNGLRLVARLSCQLAMDRQCAEVLAILSDAAIVNTQRNTPSQKKSDTGKTASEVSSRGNPEDSGGIKKRPSVLAALQAKRAGSGSGGSERSSKTSSTSTNRAQSPSSSKPLPTIQLSHALCLEALFQLGVQSAVASPQCWEPVLRSCAYISDLEASLFTILSPSDVNQQLRSAQQNESGKSNSLANILRRDTGSSSSSNDNGPTSPAELLSESSMIQAISHLSALADRLFMNAAHLLPLPALITFLQYLSRASQEQLATRSKSGKDPTAGLLLRRYTPLLLAVCGKSQRPLAHLLQAWNSVSQHLIEGACYKERAVATIAADCLHQVMSECIKNRAELPLFSFHKTLLMPMESIVCLGICDLDTQDQIVCALCELVEASRINIGSGWSVVFGALRSVRFGTSEPPGGKSAKGTGDEMSNPNPVMDIIDTVLKSDNAALISDAAMDCVECMLKFLSAGHAQSDVLAQKALDGVGVCHELFVSIHHLSSYPDFRGAAEIQDISSKSSFLASDSTGLLRVWFLLFRGMCDALPYCPSAVQPHLVDKLFTLIESAWTGVPGKGFALKVMEELLLPSLHRWLQSGINLSLRWKKAEVQSFKHCCGRLVSHVSDLVLPVLQQEGDTMAESDEEFMQAASEMMQSVLDLMVDCVIQPEEALATMGNASLRFLLLGTGGQLPKGLWQLACTSLSQALRLTLQPLELVLGQFEPYRRNLSGRSDRVKITCKKNMAVSTAFRVLHLAKQAFVLPLELQELQRASAELDESQECSRAASPEKASATVSKPGVENEASLTIHDEDLHSTIEECAVSSTRATESFSFFWSVPLPSASLFHRPGARDGGGDGAEDRGAVKKKKVRVPFRSLTVSLVTHQLVLHTLSDVLLGVGSGERLEQRSGGDASNQSKSASSSGTLSANAVLKQFTPGQLDSLLDGVLASSQLACSFNRRPGFRLAVAKVGALEQHTPHLLRQLSIGLRVYIHCLLQLLDCNSQALDAWFQQDKDDSSKEEESEVADDGASSIILIEDVISKPSVVRDTTAVLDSQRNHSEEEPEAGESVFDRSAVITKSRPPLSLAKQLWKEREFLRVVMKKVSASSPGFQWVASRIALFSQRLISYIQNLSHQHEVDAVEDEARLLSERVGEKAESGSTNILITDLQAVPVCITSQEWRTLELDQWLSLLEEILNTVCGYEDQQFECLVPFFYAPIVSLCSMDSERVHALTRLFFTRYGRLQGLVPQPEANGGREGDDSTEE
ncbi:brefeldin A-inhibited guanine nucleotide-exchange protein 3-like [Sycon ciliatum]|uniref:brefeldin A-inhibited guanine nucleotide-exchange protein 3-like n=1 Tax=Sycon ciliatum TaxID=27933 RepID=UPI0031F640C1